MSERKTLDLKLTVTGSDPDYALRPVPGKKAQLRYNGHSLDVSKIERADGQEIGLEGEFETYWAETHTEEYEPGRYEKAEALDAFLYGVQYAKKRGW